VGVLSQGDEAVCGVFDVLFLIEGGLVEESAEFCDFCVDVEF
jgi:hypothetical protein